MKLFVIVSAVFALSAPASATRCTYEGPEDNTRVFADVPASHPLCVEIESLYRDGLTAGCRVEDDGARYFCPGENLTRGMAAMFSEHRDPFAQINRDGKIEISDHVADSGRYDRGIYWVTFTRDVQFCSYEGWPHSLRGPAVTVDVSRLSPTIDTVIVETTFHGSPVDMDFNVRLHCR